MATVRKSRVLGTISLLITIFSLSFPAYAKYSGGIGEPNNPYQIATAEDLILLGQSLEDYDKHFIMTADIDLSGQIFTVALIAPSTDVPYRFDGTAFTGVFDGNGHKITGLTINQVNRTDYIGLFGYSSGKITNLGIEGSSVSGMNYVGGLVGVNDGTVWNCYASGNVIGRGFSVGGLVGRNKGNVSNCYSVCDVKGNWCVGGFVGMNEGIVCNCYSAGDVNGNSDFGGLSGMNGTMSNCFWDTDMQTHGVTESIGFNQGTANNVAGLTTAQMQTEGTFTSAGWDLIGESANGTNETWRMPSNGGYPVLSFFHNDIPVPLAGSGTAVDPFLIGTAEELGMINWYADDCCFKLTSDIDLSGISWSMSIVPVFRGHFDGNGHVIINMQISGFSSCGMFGYLRQGGQLTNLGLQGGSVTATGRNIGGLVGANGDLRNPGGTITNCYWIGDVRGDEYVGGLVGQNYAGDISDCHSIGNIIGNSVVGGLVGKNGDLNYPGGNITNCQSSGGVSGQRDVGGLVGANYGVRVSSCYSTVDVKAGYWWLKQVIGGLIGYNQESNVSNCYSTGPVSGFELVGGLIGSNNDSTITNCYSVSHVSGDNRVGGLCGQHSISGGIINCFWDKETSGSLYSAGGWAMTTAEMMTESTYVGWDNGTWVIDEGKDYPHLAREGTVGEVIDYEYPRTYPGNGEDLPFELDSPADLVCMSLRPADWNKSFVLAGDVDMSSVIGYRPTSSFTGSFDGQGNALKNLKIYPSILGNHYHLGVFGRIAEGGRVVDLAAEEVNIVAGDFSRYLGGLCGENAGGTISGCYTTGTILGGVESDDLGGLCGDNDGGTISHSHSSASVFSGDDSHDLGGLCGKNEGTLTDCYATGEVSGRHLNELGGLCGENDGGTITDCHATGSVTTSSSSNNLGGLVGNSFAGTIRDCYSTGSVSGGVDSLFLGGLVGSNRGSTISSCYSIGAVTANAHSRYLGGLVGDNRGATISNCYAKGSVSGGEYSWLLGGLVGSNEASTIRNCYSIGPVSGGTDVGGLCGKHSVAGAIVNSYWDKDTSGYLYSAGGWAMTTSEMMTESTYVGWNNSAWVIDQGKDYPHLLWEGTTGDVIDYEYPRIYPGNGQDQPFELDSPDDVLCMSLRPADWDKNFVLTSNIDMSSVIYYQPPTPFTGSFDGQGHVLKNLTIDSSVIGGSYYLGAFGKIGEDGQVANLGVEDVNIISGDDSRYVGGLCGENDRGTITCCFTTGSVTGGLDSDDLGGLCGDNERGTITQSYSCVSVSAGDGSHDLGGLCGKNEGTITDCYATGAVSGGLIHEVGGFCGENHRQGIIMNCYSIGSVSGGSQVGGFCGDKEGGDVSNVSNCLWDVETSGTLRSDAGTGLTTAQMQQAQTFLDIDWDFVNETANGTEDIWWIFEGQDYPRLCRKFSNDY